MGTVTGSWCRCRHVLTTGRIEFRVDDTDADYQLDNILIINDDLGTTATTFAHNNANELTSQTVNGVTTNFTYDDWGRTVSKYTANTSADYTYAYGSKLQSATMDYPGTDDDATVTYQYGGDGKRRARTQGADETWYNWGMGYSVISEEDDAGGDTGALTRTYIGSLGEVAGSNPTTGTYRYYHQDYLGSIRALSDDDKIILGAFDHTPYGAPDFTTAPTDVTHRYTGHDWDPGAGLYFAPFRHYNPNLARWTSRDPLDMIDGTNMYAYVMGDPVNYRDFLGLWGKPPALTPEDCEVAGRYLICRKLLPDAKRKCKKQVDNRCKEGRGKLFCCQADQAHAASCGGEGTDPTGCALDALKAFKNCMLYGGKPFPPPPSCRPKPKPPRRRCS